MRIFPKLERWWHSQVVDHGTTYYAHGHADPKNVDHLFSAAVVGGGWVFAFATRHQMRTFLGRYIGAKRVVPSFMYLRATERGTGARCRGRPVLTPRTPEDPSP